MKVVGVISDCCFPSNSTLASKLINDSHTTVTYSLMISRFPLDYLPALVLEGISGTTD